MKRIHSKLSLFVLIFAATIFAADESQPEAGERALNAVESEAALKTLADSFKAHPTIRAKILSEIEDLAGKRTEEGELLLDRGAGHPARVLRTFTKPKPKAWLLDGSSIAECAPSQKKVFVKDLSAAPKMLAHIQAAMIGDIRALESIFTLKIFSKPGANGSTDWRFILDKKPGVSKYVHHRIEARMISGGLFFSEIHYVPDEGDELTEKFLELKDAGALTDADFTLKGSEGLERATERITE